MTADALGMMYRRDAVLDDSQSTIRLKGAQFEVDVMKWFRKMGAVAETLTLIGSRR